MASLHSDQPNSEDIFGRRPFAEALSATICGQSDPSPLSISISGAWGEGKTTALGFLENSLRNNKVVVVKFNPWRYHGEDELLRSFFATLAEGLDEQLLSDGERLSDWTKKNLAWLPAVAKLIPGAGEAVDGASQQLGLWLTPAIDALRSRIRSKLREKKRRVVVLLDDPDRLDADDLFALFRIVKLTADFDYVTFVLAMDYESVASVVGRRFGGLTEGNRFLEKLIQVPLRLPTIPPSQLRRFALQLLNDALKDLCIDLDESEVGRFHSMFDGAILPGITTPRTAKVYANISRFTLGLMPGEVNVVDVLTLEGIRIFHPKLFERLPPNILANPNYSILEDLFYDNEKRGQRLLQKLLGEDYKDNTAIGGVLTQIFVLQLSSHELHDDNYAKLAIMKRVTCEEYAIRYFAATIPENDISDLELDAVVASADKVDQEEGKRLLEPLITEKSSLTLVRKLSHRGTKLSQQQLRTLSVAIALNCNSFTRTTGREQWNSAFGQSAGIVGEWIQKLESADAQKEFCLHLIEIVPSMRWAIDLFRSLPHKPKRAPNTQDLNDVQWFNEIITQELGSRLAQKVMRSLEADYEQLPTNDIEIALWHCSLYCSPEEIRPWFETMFERHHDIIEPLVTSSLGTSSDGRQVSYLWTGSGKVSDYVSKFCDLEMIAEKLATPVEPPARLSHREELTKDEAVYRFITFLKGQHAQKASPENCQAPGN